MLGRRVDSMKKLAKKFKRISTKPQHDDCHTYTSLMVEPLTSSPSSSSSPSTTKTAPHGTFAVYVGEDRERFIVPTHYLSHPLFRILLEKAYDDRFGFDQRHGLLVPCSADAFREVLSAVECCTGRFDFGNLLKEFV